MLGLSEAKIYQGIWNDMSMIIMAIPWWVWVATIGVGIFKTKIR